MPLESRPDHHAEPVHGHQRPEREDRRHGGSDDFFGLNVDAVSPRAQVAASLAVLIPVAVGGMEDGARVIIHDPRVAAR